MAPFSITPSSATQVRRLVQSSTTSIPAANTINPQINQTVGTG